MAEPAKIKLQGVRKSFAGKEVLRGLDLDIPRGQTMVIVGGSGTGKSVTLKHMVGLLRPDEGDVLVDGESVSQARGRDLERLRQKFGLLFQSGALLAWMDVAENIALPLYEKTKLGDAEIQEKVKHTLALLNLQGAERKRPSELSGGMRKRVALARAIITEPEILLYDEPTSGLDPLMSRHVDQLISSMQQKLGITSVVVTHDLVSAFTIGAQVAMLHQGRVELVAPPAEFRASANPIVQEFIRAQFATGPQQGVPA